MIEIKREVEVVEPVSTTNVEELLAEKFVQDFLNRAMNFQWLPKTKTLKVTTDKSRTKWIKPEHSWTPSQAIAFYEEHFAFHAEHIPRMTPQKRSVEARKIEKRLVGRVAYFNNNTDGGKYKYLKYQKLERQLIELFEKADSVDHWGELEKMTQSTDLPFDKILKLEITELPIVFLANEETITRELERRASILSDRYTAGVDTSAQYEKWLAEYKADKAEQKLEEEHAGLEQTLERDGLKAAATRKYSMVSDIPGMREHYARFDQVFKDIRSNAANRRTELLSQYASETDLWEATF